MPSQEKKITLHLVNPLLFTKYGKPEWVEFVTIIFEDRVKLFISGDQVWCPFFASKTCEMFAPVIETKDEIKEMVGAACIKFVEFKTENV